MNNKISYKRFRGEKYDKQGDVFGEMQVVSLDELQNLSKMIIKGNDNKYRRV